MAQQRGLREGDLRDHQPGLESQASCDHDAGRVLQRLLQRQTSGVQRRRQSEQHTGDERQAERERDAAPVDLDREVRNAGIEQTEEQPDHEQPQRTGGHRQHHGLGHELSNDAAPAGAEREPHGDLAPARDAETGEQRADVRARDQQDEHRKHQGDHAGRPSAPHRRPTAESSCWRSAGRRRWTRPWPVDTVVCCAARAAIASTVGPV